MQNFMKTILSAVQTWTKGKIKESITASTADWNQNDESVDNYVKNRTHWEEEDGTIHKLDSKYLDLPTNLATTDDVSTKMDANNPVGTGSFSMNRKAGTTVGDNSHTEGYGATASGNNSHAEGSNTTASAFGSHAEGYSTTASGVYSHAEGICTTASEQAQHTQGRFNSITKTYNLKFNDANLIYLNTGKSYEYSHEYSFDPYTGVFSLVNPITNTPNGITVLSPVYLYHNNSWYKLLDGYNDYVASTFTAMKIDIVANTYAHIVGNGTSDTERSNAHTLDWNGVGWYQGGLQVGGNAQDDGAKNVLLEGDAIPIPETASVGQTIAVKSVDENGKPVEWEVADISTSGGFGCIASDTPPEDTSVIWIDTADNSDDTLQDAVNIALAQAKESGEFKGDPGKTPEKGVDYYTDTDKAELVNAVLSALPAWTGGSY